MTVSELRIHGVGGSPGPRLLGYVDETLTQIVGPAVPATPSKPLVDDGRSIVIRRRRYTTNGPVIGFDWGNLDSGRPVQALWVLLLPFTLINAAGWMIGAGGEEPGVAAQKARWWDRVAARLVIVLGLLLTATTTAWIVQLCLGYVGYQFLAVAMGSPMVLRGPGTQTLTLTHDLEARQQAGVLLGLVLALIVLGLLTDVARRSHRRGTAGADDVEDAPDAAAPLDSATLHQAMERSRRTVRRRVLWHLACASTVLLVMVGQSVLALRRTTRPTVLPTDTTVVALSGTTVVVLVALWLATRRTKARRGGPSAAAAVLAFMLSTGLLAGLTMWSVQHLPRLIQAPICQVADVSAPSGELEKDCANAAVPGENRTAADVGSGTPALAPGRELAYVDEFAYTILAWTLFALTGAGWIWLRPPAAGERKDVGRWRRAADVVHRVDRPASVLAYSAWATLAWSVVTHVDREGHGLAVWQWVTEPPDVDGFAYRVGAWAMPAFAVLIALRVRKGISDNRVRRFFGQAWDVLSFFPRSYHPLAVRPYCHEAVPRFQQEVRALLPTAALHRSVLVSAHSQGTAIAFTAIDGLQQPEVDRLAFVTYGSHLGTLYRRCFPRWFGEPRAARLRDRMPATGAPRWRNFFRLTDPIGGPIFEVPGYDEQLDDPATATPTAHVGEPPLERDREPGTTIAGHSWYLAEQDLKTAVADLKTRLAREV